MEDDIVIDVPGYGEVAFPKGTSEAEMIKALKSLTAKPPEQAPQAPQAAPQAPQAAPQAGPVARAPVATPPKPVPEAPQVVQTTPQPTLFAPPNTHSSPSVLTR